MTKEKKEKRYYFLVESFSPRIWIDYEGEEINVFKLSESDFEKIKKIKACGEPFTDGNWEDRRAKYGR
jgi:hypothetical protein